jgi:hypothetical protein
MDTAALALTGFTTLAALLAALASWRTAHETRRGWEATQRADRLRVLEEIHELVGHITELGWSERANPFTKMAISMGGGPQGLYFTTGQDLRGKVAASHCDLPACKQVADMLIAGTARSASCPAHGPAERG